ncbi:collagen alpha-1(I) chain-like [Emys orbicularis]|uniref:collagen alpha-1(I) chain-like n=1 Tax=Emys orbicularis TaxID=82168 RepID=UPI0031FCCDD5
MAPHKRSCPQCLRNTSQTILAPASAPGVQDPPPHSASSLGRACPAPGASGQHRAPRVQAREKLARAHCPGSSARRFPAPLGEPPPGPYLGSGPLGHGPLFPAQAQPELGRAGGSGARPSPRPRGGHERFPARPPGAAPRARGALLPAGRAGGGKGRAGTGRGCSAGTRGSHDETRPPAGSGNEPRGWIPTGPGPARPSPSSAPAPGWAESRRLLATGRPRCRAEQSERSREPRTRWQGPGAACGEEPAGERGRQRPLAAGGAQGTGRAGAGPPRGRWLQSRDGSCAATSPSTAAGPGVPASPGSRSQGIPGGAQPPGTTRCFG